MITLTAQIDLISSHSDTLEADIGSLSKNNISSPLGDIRGVKKVAKNPFIIGASKIGERATIESSVDYFVGGQLSDENGVFNNGLGYTITISGENISNFTIAFDTTNNRHPKYIVVDRTQHSDDDAIYTITNLDESLSSHTIEIYSWNSPKYPLVITGIYVGLKIEINNRNLISLNCDIFDRGDLKLPSYGIISNVGNIEFNDLDGEVRDYARQLLLNAGLNCTISLNNTLVKDKTEQVAQMQTNEWNYDNNSREVSVSLKDDLEEWQNIVVPPKSYNPNEPTTTTALSIYEDLYYATPLKYNMLNIAELGISYNKAYSILSNTRINYYTLNGGSLWEQWQKLCELCGLYIYKNKDNRTVCNYTYGS